MKIGQSLVLAVLVNFSANVFAAEECPVSKISLARGLACEALRLAQAATEADTNVDRICLKLGRTSAIYRRTQGQLPNTNIPVPPTEWKQRAIEIEGFCGLGTDTALPRGLVNPTFVLDRENGLAAYLRERVRENTEWMNEHKQEELASCPAPAVLTEEDVRLCL